jgi:hypothetical protein
MAQTAVNRREFRNLFGVPGECFDYVVLDPEGRRVGRVKELFTNTYGEPEYVRVRVGLFGLRSVLVPVTFVIADEERRTLTLQ